MPMGDGNPWTKLNYKSAVYRFIRIYRIFLIFCIDLPFVFLFVLNYIFALFQHNDLVPYTSDIRHFLSLGCFAETRLTFVYFLFVLRTPVGASPRARTVTRRKSYWTEFGLSDLIYKQCIWSN